MERIGETIKSLQQDTLLPTLHNLPGQRTIETDYTEDNEEKLKANRLSFLNVSTLEHTFESYHVTSQNKAAFTQMRLLSIPENKKKFCLLYGVPGNGKTHLIEAFCIVRYARYNTMSQLMRNLKQSIRLNTYDDIFKRLCELNILIIDDYGAGVQTTNFEVADIEAIIDERYQKRYKNDGKITIMATNQDIKTLPDRIVRRFRDPEFGCLVLNEAGDFGRQK